MAADTPWGTKIKTENTISSDEDREEWTRMQKNTFTKWANVRLIKVKARIEDLYSDLHDGLILVQLLQAITGEPFPRRYTKKPKMRIQKMENLNIIMDYLREKGLSLVNIGSTDILDGNSKIILGLVWTLILRFEVGDIQMENSSGKEALLLWCRRSLKDYPSIPIENFSSSWKDGRAFCALLHRYRPDLLDMKDIKETEGQGGGEEERADAQKANLSLAFRVADEHLGVAQLIDVEDIVNVPRPDEKVIITYVTQLFKVFASSQKREKSVKTICHAIDITRRHDEWKAEYETVGKELERWLEEKILFFSQERDIRSLADIQRLQEKINEYKQREKGEREAQQLLLESLNSRLRSSCMTNNRPYRELSPSVASLRSLWVKLGQEEASVQERLRENYEKFLLLDFEVQKFSSGAKKVESWAEEKLQAIEAEGEDLVTSAAVEARLEAFVNVRDQQLPRFMSLLSSLQGLEAGLPEEHSETSRLRQWLKEIEAKTERISLSLPPYLVVLEKKLEEHRELDRMEKEISSSVAPLLFLLEEIEEHFDEPVQQNKIQSIEAALKRFEDETGGERGRELASLSSLFQERLSRLLAAGRTVDLPTMDHKTLTDRIEEVNSRREKRRQDLEKMLERAKRADRLCQKFASLVDPFKTVMRELQRAGEEKDTENTGKSMEEKYKELQSLRSQHVQASQNKSQWVQTLSSIDFTEDAPEETGQEKEGDQAGKEEEKVSLLQELREQTGPAGELFLSLETINQQLESAHILSNPYTADTIQSLRVLWNSYGDNLQKSLESLQSEMQKEEFGNLSVELYAEIKEIFQYFDGDANGYIGFDEFSKACVGVGFSLEEEEKYEIFSELEREERKKETEQEREENRGEISLRTFCTFCEAQLQSGSRKEHVLKSFKELAEAGEGAERGRVGGKGRISLPVIHRAFRQDYADYMEERMRTVEPEEEMGADEERDRGLSRESTGMGEERGEGVLEAEAVLYKDYEAFTEDLFAR